VLVSFYWSMCCHIPEDSNFHVYCHENLKSHCNWIRCSSVEIKI
jgi:hypothetical protein